jgi:hypothetical protein
VQSNQWIEEPEAREAPGRIFSRTTLGDCHAEGRWRAEQFKVPLLWRLAISNSALFWRSDSRSDLRADDVPDAVLQEWVRAFRIRDDVYFLGEPLGLWRANGPDSRRAVTAGPRGRGFNSFLRREKAIQAIRRAVHRSIATDDDGAQVLSDRFATPLEIREEGARRALVLWPAPSRLAWRRRIELFAKASALRLCPLALFEALEQGLAPLRGIDFGQASPPSNPSMAMLTGND